ncbi:MAG: carboxypeptidase regulatory-like domain-containing protein [Endomicrobiaceae bacterium]
MRKIFSIFLLNFSLLFFCINIYSADDFVSISGRISRSSAAGVSLNDITIDVTGTSNMRVKTDRYGNYIIHGLPKGGTYTLTISKEGYSFSPNVKTYRGLTESKINENFIASVSNYSISGRVLVGGKPVRGATIMISQRNIKYITDYNGAYVIDNLEYDGPYTVSVISDEHYFEPFTVPFLDKDIVHDFEKDIYASGRVTSLGQGVANIDIDVNGVKYKTDDQGFYKVKGLKTNGDYMINVPNNNDFVVSPKNISLKKISQDEENLNFSVSGYISGTVKYNGKPFPGAILKVSDRQKEYKTNSAGFYKIDDLGINQEYNLTISSTGYSFNPESRTIKQLISEPNVQDFTASVLKYKVNIIVMQGKKPLKDAEVSVQGIKGIFKTNADGKCEIALNYGKEYVFSVNKKGISFTESKQTVKDLKADTELIFESLLSVSGIVKTVNLPLKDAVISYGDKLSVKTNKEGKYVINNLKPNNEYKISVSSNNFIFDPEIIIIDNLSDNEIDKNFTAKSKYKAATETKFKQDLTEQSKIEEKAKEAEVTEKAAETKAAEATAAVTSSAGVSELLENSIQETEPVLTKEEKKRLAKEEKERIKAEKAEKKRLAQEEKIRLKAEKEEQKRLAKEEAKKKALEIEAQKDAEQKIAEEPKTEEPAAQIKEEKVKEAEVTEKAAETKAADATAAVTSSAGASELLENSIQETEPVLTKEEKKRLAKEEKERIKAEKAEKKRLAQEEKIRLKAEKEEQKRLAKEEARRQAIALEEQQLAEKEAELKKEEEKLKASEQSEKEKNIKEESSIKESSSLNTIKASSPVSVPAVALLTKEEKKRLAKEEKERIKAEKAEKKRLAQEEKIRLKAEKEEQKRLAKEEAKKKALEIEAQKTAEKERLEEEKLKAEQELQAKEADRLKTEQEEKDRLTKEAEQKRLEEEKVKAEKELQAKKEADKLKAEQEEKDRLAKEAEQKRLEEEKVKAEKELQAKKEADKLKAEQEEKDRLAKEAEQKRLEEEKAEKELQAKKEADKLKAEQEEKDRLAKEAEQKRLEEEKAKAEKELQAKKEADKLKAEQEEKDRLAKEAEQKRLEEEKAKELQAAKIESNKKKFSISGRVLKGKMGVQGVQVRLLIDDEERIYLTDNNGFYKIPDLISGYNYTITVISGKEVLNLSPKTRTYKKVTKNIENQNFYVIEKFNKQKEEVKQEIKKNEAKEKAEQKKEVKSDEGEVDEYGLRNKNGLIQAEIHW